MGEDERILHVKDPNVMPWFVMILFEIVSDLE